MLSNLDAGQLPSLVPERGDLRLQCWEISVIYFNVQQCGRREFPPGNEAGEQPAASLPFDGIAATAEQSPEQARPMVMVVIEAPRLRFQAADPTRASVENPQPPQWQMVIAGLGDVQANPARFVPCPARGCRRACWLTEVIVQYCRHATHTFPVNQVPVGDFSLRHVMQNHLPEQCATNSSASGAGRGWL
jgi:hypothetical protein